MGQKALLFLTLVVLACFVNGKVLQDEVDRTPERRDAVDQISSAEYESRRTHLEDQLRQLNQRRRHRYDKDKRCCERCIDRGDNVNDEPCCQRLQNQECPYREEKRCGVPEVTETRQREIIKKVTKIIEVTVQPPHAIITIEKQRIAKLEADLRQLRSAEETRLYNLEEQRRLALEEELRRELEDDETRYVDVERDRRETLERELTRLKQEEKYRVDAEGGRLKRDLEAKLEAERRLEEDERRRREESLRAQLEAQLGYDEEKISRIERERRSNLDYELQNERQNAAATRKKRHDDRRAQLENELKEQRKRDLDRLAELEEQRRREFEEEIRKLRLSYEQRRTEVVEVDEVSYENVPVEFQNVKQQCCYRCAGQSCGEQGCPDDATDCPKKCDRCRCNHSFVSCPGNGNQPGNQ